MDRAALPDLTRTHDASCRHPRKIVQAVESMKSPRRPTHEYWDWWGKLPGERFWYLRRAVAALCSWNGQTQTDVRPYPCPQTHDRLNAARARDRNRFPIRSAWKRQNHPA